MDIVISVLVFVCLILIIVLIGGKGNYVHSDTKEIVCRVHEYFQSEYDDAKNVGQVGLQQTSSNVSFKNLIEFHFKMFCPIC